MSRVFHLRISLVLLLLAIIVLPVLDPAFASETTVTDSLADSLQARHPEKPATSTGDRLLAIPSMVLKVPVFVLEHTTKGAMYLALRTSFVRSIIDLLREPTRPISPIASYSSNEGLMGGLSLKTFGLAGDADRLRLKGTYSTNDYSLVDLKYTNNELSDGRLGIVLNGAYSRRPRETFFGIGIHSRESNEVAFTREQSFGRLSLTVDLIDEVTVSGFGGIERNNIFDGGDPDLPGELPVIRDSLNLSPGAFRTTQFYTVGGSIAYDNRDLVGQPSRGGLQTFEVTYNRGFGDFDDLEYVRTRLELTQYVNVYSKRIFAFRLLLQNIDRSDDVPPNPVYLLSSLGGPETLRSYDKNRFVNRDMALATVEYRYPVWDIIDAFLFLDEGRVFDEMSNDFTLDDWHYSAGFGLRVWSPDEVVVTAQVAFGAEGSRFSFVAGTGF